LGLGCTGSWGLIVWLIGGVPAGKERGC